MSLHVVITKAEAVGELVAEIGLQAALLADQLERPGPPPAELARCVRLLTDARVRLNAARAALTALEQAAPLNGETPARETPKTGNGRTIATGTGR